MSGQTTTNTGGGEMASKRDLGCGREVIAVGQEGSVKDLETKLNNCFLCSNFVARDHMIHNAQRLAANLENLRYMANKIKEERKLA
jgi:hypothetical protein